MTAESAEFVLVGGGIYGGATAYEIARRGHEVVVLEAETIGAGASGGLGKRGVRANGRDLRELPLMHRAYDRWPTLSDELGAPTGWERTGQLRLYERPHDVGEAEVRARVQSRAGVPTTHLTRAALLEIEPGLGDVVLGALHCPLDGVADHPATTRAYAAAAERLGARVVEGTRVEAIERDGRRATGVRLADGSRVGVERHLVLLNNAGLPTLLGAAGSTLPVWSVLPQVVVSEPVDPPPFRSLIGHAHRPLALKMIPGGRVMMSGGWRGRWNAGLGRGETIPAYVMGNVAQAVAVLPALEGVRIEESAADRLETICFDGVPIIDRAPGTENVVFAVGWTGHGWAIAPAVSELLADWLIQGERPDLLRPFGLARFGS
jgi:sarcosine oxidase subunit beta